MCVICPEYRCFLNVLFFPFLDRVSETPYQVFTFPQKKKKFMSTNGHMPVNV